MRCLAQQGISALMLDSLLQSRARPATTLLKSANRRRIPAPCVPKVCFDLIPVHCGAGLTFITRFFLRAENSIRHAAAAVSRWNVH